MGETFHVEEEPEQWVLSLDPHWNHNACFLKDFMLEELDNNADIEKTQIL